MKFEPVIRLKCRSCGEWNDCWALELHTTKREVTLTSERCECGVFTEVFPSLRQSYSKSLGKLLRESEVLS